MFKPILFIICFMLTTSFSLANSRLPKDIELERLLLAVESSFTEGAFESGLEFLNRAKSLDVDLPARFYYFEAQYFNSNNKFKEAYMAYEDYILLVGKEGTYFKQSLLALNELERKIALNDTQVAPEGLPNDNNILWSSNKIPKNISENKQDYIEEIKKLYLTNSIQDALVSHINSLLISSPYTGQSPLKGPQETRIEYSILISEDKKITINKVQKINNASQILAFKTSVFGLSSEFDLSCDASMFICSIKHKDNYTTWFELSHNPDLSEEIIRASQLLIQTLQAQ